MTHESLIAAFVEGFSTLLVSGRYDLRALYSRANLSEGSERFYAERGYLRNPANLSLIVAILIHRLFRYKLATATRVYAIVKRT